MAAEAMLCTVFTFFSDVKRFEQEVNRKIGTCNFFLSFIIRIWHWTMALWL